MIHMKYQALFSLWKKKKKKKKNSTKKKTALECCLLEFSMTQTQQQTVKWIYLKIEKTYGNELQ